MLKVRDAVDWGGGWVWPVPDDVRDGERHPAIISQEFKRPAHLGVDLMYRWPGTRYFAPPDTPVLAARNASVWSVTRGPRGIAVVLDHGVPFATFYQHLASVQVVKGQQVVAGEQIGVMGADPTDLQNVRHLHFAVWYKGNGDNSSVDPAAAMASWRRVDWT
jgi:murein DD-endopeptidase MepM/ murein hydrolase activator NlpD